MNNTKELGGNLYEENRKERADTLAFKVTGHYTLDTEACSTHVEYVLPQYQPDRSAKQIDHWSILLSENEKNWRQCTKSAFP